MDETQTQPNRTSDAAAVRKRRSSILKSQRPPRTPFSELEFNVATPTDSGKSRRVSFSRRTGVAEFVTNEATTTWKNFYEEHNKSLESSGNDSGVNGPRPIGHIGKSIFDQQFEEIETIDFIGSLQKPSGLNINTSLNNDNFTQQLASLECTGEDRKLFAPQTNFELSTFTDHQSKLFGDDLTVPCNGELSGRIDINFSSVQQICDGKDDLDEIQEDLKRSQINFVCPAPTSKRRDTLDDIEMDLNMTRVSVKNDESDMSITDTVQSPKVQNVSKCLSVDKKTSASHDWTVDKENIVVNPYVAPRESANFAINEESDKVLVFDGKRLTIQSDKFNADLATIRNGCRQTNLPKKSIETIPKGNTINLDTNDDLVTFNNDDLHTNGNKTVNSCEKLQKSTIFDENDMSMTRPLNNDLTLKKQRTIIYDNDTGDISVTQAIPTHISKPDNGNLHSGKRRTIIFENDTGNISITKALPPNIIVPQQTDSKTFVYANDTGNISVTQAVPSNILLSNYCETDNISMTQVLPSNIILPDKNERIPNKRKTILYEDDSGNISITRVVPGNIILPEKHEMSDKRRTILYEDNTGNISVTQPVPTNIDIPLKSKSSETRRTIVYENDTGNISITQALQSNIILRDIIDAPHQSFSEDISMTQAVPANILCSEKAEVPNKRRTIVYENDTGNLSITQAVSVNRLIPGYTDDKKGGLMSHDGNICVKPVDHNDEEVDKKQTMFYENDAADISMTQDIRASIILAQNSRINDKRRTIVFDDNAGNISMTQTLPPNILSQNPDIFKDSNITAGMAKNSTVSESNHSTMFANISIEEKESKSKTVSFDQTNDVNMSCNQSAIGLMEKRKTVIFNNESGNISTTKPIPGELYSIQKEIVNKSRSKNINISKRGLDVSHQHQASNVSDVLVYQAATRNSNLPLQTKKTEQGDSKSERFISSNIGSKDEMVSIAKIIDIIETETIQDIAQKLTRKEHQSPEKDIIEQPLECVTEEFVEANISIEHIKHKHFIESEEEQKSASVISYEKPNIALVKIKESSTSDIQMCKETKITSETNNIAESASLKHKHSTESNVSDHKNHVAKVNSILDELLNMSSTSMRDDMVHKNSVTQTETDSPEKVEMKPDTDSSDGSLFYITRDSEEETQTDKVSAKKSKSSVTFAGELSIINKQPPLTVGSKDELKPYIVIDILKEQDELPIIEEEEKNPPQNRHFEKILSSDLDSTVKQECDISKNKEYFDPSQNRKCFKNANDTNELLEMLSDLTEKESSNLNKTRQEENKPESNIIKGLITNENKSENRDPRRMSFATNRQSIVLSREDLLNNISMAQAALQKSKVELDESDDVDDTDMPTPAEPDEVSKRSLRLSNEVVKTLNFEDESFSDSSNQNETKLSTLKKTAFEDTYMKENKANVIPSYLKDVSDGIKHLMQDLVKPMADVVPLASVELQQGLNKVPSTCSTQIQANLITSSQIDVTTELYSNPESLSEINKINSPSGKKDNIDILAKPESCSSDFIESPKRQPVDQTVPGKVIVFDHNNPLNNVVLASIDFTEVHKYNPGQSTETLCDFERNDSAQISFTDIDEAEKVSLHYNVESHGIPKVYQSGDTCSEKIAEAESITSNISKPVSVDQSTDALYMDVKETEVNTIIAMKANKELLAASSSLTLVDDTLAHTAFDVFIDAQTVSQESTKLIYRVNEQNDRFSDKIDSDFISDAVSEPVRETTKSKKRIYSPTKREEHRHCTFAKLDVTPKPITKMQKLSESPTLKHNIEKNKVIASNTQLAPKSTTKIQKLPDSSTHLKRRISTEKHKPIVEKCTPSVDMSPKHINKVQRLSDSSAQMKRKTPEKCKKNTKVNIEAVIDTSTDSQQSFECSKKSNNSNLYESKRSKSKRPGTNITVQQLITEYHNVDIGEKILKEQTAKSMLSDTSSVEPNSRTDMHDAQSVDAVNSFTSSNYFNKNRDDQCQMSDSIIRCSIKSKASNIDWPSESTESLSSKNAVSECDSSVNVVAKIDMLPFMGSHECEWESSGGDLWSFKLMHARLRLSVRLAHRHDNATRTCVSADTPVLAVALEVLHRDKKNPVAMVMVGFAVETMRYYSGCGCERAGGVPALLRRCAAAARLALRWGRAMHDARVRLAYSLAEDGSLALKVANIPLRSVWEVTMRLELVLEEARESPWPRACDVRVTRVVSDHAVAEQEVARVLAAVPRDWGHVPRTLWRIFKYLKNKTQDDDLLLRI